MAAVCGIKAPPTVEDEQHSSPADVSAYGCGCSGYAGGEAGPLIGAVALLPLVTCQTWRTPS